MAQPSTGTTPDPNSTEPLVTVGTITAAASLVVALVVTLGLKLTATQQEAILAVVGILAPAVVALWGRRRVYAPATVSRLLAAARR